MYKSLKFLNLKSRTVIFLFLFISFFAANGFAQITTDGQNFINSKTGEKVILRGFGIGCWLLPEGYMWGIRKLDRPRQFEKAIADLIGENDAQKFWRLYHKNFLTENDISAMKSWGVNSLRIPILSSVLQPREGQPSHPPYRYSEYGFGLLDTLVNWCEKYKIGIIWDMHGAPGGQNAENISDSDGNARLWTEKDKYWPMCTELWYKIAERYKDNNCIIGYDLLNEPLLRRYKEVREKLLRELYVQLTDTIRTVDSTGIIFIEGDDWAQNFELLEPMNWDRHLAIAFHSYPPTSNEKALERWDKFREKYNIPLWHGETGEQGPPYEFNLTATKFLESANVSWSWWTHKKFDLQTQPWSSVRTPGFLKILDYWNGKGNKPSEEQAKEWLFKQAKLTNSIYCQFYPDMVRSLFPLNPDDYVSSINISEPEIVVQPGNISVEEGGAVQTEVRARSFPLKYQWYKNGRELPGQNDCVLNISDPSLKDNNSMYFVRISNPEGSVNSDTIKLTVKTFAGISVRRISEPIVIDAIQDKGWEEAQAIHLNNFVYGGQNLQPDSSAVIKFLWDDSSLYVWAQVRDEIKDTVGSRDNSGDVLDIYLDPDNEKPREFGDSQYQLRYNMNEPGVEPVRGRLEGKITAAQKISKGKYVMELAIPWTAVRGKPGPGKFVGIDVNILHYENGHRRIYMLGDSSRRSYRRSPMSFGTIKLD